MPRIRSSVAGRYMLDFYTNEGRELILGKNALRIWKFPGA
jgi:hypothetical protein